MQHDLAVLIAPLFPLLCLGLVLWLDHLEETLASHDKATPTPARAGEPSEAGMLRPAQAPVPGLAVSGLGTAASD